MDMEQTQPQPQERRPDSLKEAFEWIESFIGVLAPLLLVMALLGRPATVFGISMMPTLQEGDRLLLQQIAYEPQLGDVVVIDRNTQEESNLIKRVIGCAGDVIDIDFQQGIVYRNGEALDEPYINEPTFLQMDVEFPVTVPEGCIFVMGDNRNHSDDSRDSEIGMVDTRRVMGKALFRFFPLDRIGGIS